MTLICDNKECSWHAYDDMKPFGVCTRRTTVVSISGFERNNVIIGGLKKYLECITFKKKGKPEADNYSI